jgi:chromosomal replication initiator protein
MEPKDKHNPWLQIKETLRKKIDKNSYETWFEPTSYIGKESNSLYIKVPNSYFKDWLAFHYSGLINKCSQNSLGKVFDIKFIFDEDSPSFKRRSPQERKSKRGPLLNPNLNPNYTFQNFVVGVHATSLPMPRPLPSQKTRPRLTILGISMEGQDWAKPT